MQDVDIAGLQLVCILADAIYCSPSSLPSPLFFLFFLHLIVYLRSNSHRQADRQQRQNGERQSHPSIHPSFYILPS